MTVRLHAYQKKAVKWLFSNKSLLKYMLVHLTTLSSVSSQNIGELTSYGNLHTSVGSTIYSICMDADRVLWVGTSKGILKFDGEHFYPVDLTIDSADHLQSEVMALSFDHWGYLWISTRRGLYRRNQNSEEYDQPFRQYLPDWTSNIFWTQEGRKGWLVSVHQLCVIDSDSLRIDCFKIPESNSLFYSLSAVVEDHQGTIWFTSGYALWSFDPVTEEMINHSLNAQLDEIWLLYLTSKGEVLAGSRSNGVYQIDQGVVKSLGPQGYFIKSLYVDDDKIWVGGGNNGLDVFKRDENGMSKWITPPSYSFGWANSFWNDPDQNILWVGSEKSLIKIEQQSDALESTSLNIVNDGYPSYILNFHEDKYNPGLLWLKIIDQGIGLWNNQEKSLRIFNPPKPFGKSNSGFLADSQDRFWILTYEEPNIWIFDLNDQSWSSPSWAEPWRECRAIFEDRNRDIWIGTSTGALGKYSTVSKQIQEVTSLTSLLSDTIDPDIIQIGQSQSGLIWALTYHQLFKINADNIATEVKPNTLAHLNDLFLSLHIDQNDGIWIGSRNGLRYLNLDESIDTFYTAWGTEKLQNIYNIKSDMLGNYWLGTNNGLLRINPATRHIRKITSDDGLVSDKTYFLSLQPSGNLYIGYPAAFNSIDTRKFELDTFTPELKIMDIRIMDQPVRWKENEQITINPFQNYFSIQYALLNYHKSSLNSYRYILEGFDQRWHEAGTNNIATYTNLPAGNYKFKLQAANNDNIWTRESELAKIQVLAPFYRQLWFRVSCFMVAVGLIYFYYYLQKKERSRLKSLRTQIARDLHDEVGSSLSSIGFLSQLVQNQSNNESFRVEPIMQKISQTAGNISDAMAGIIWTLQDEQPQFSHIVQRLESFGKRVVEAQGSELEIQVDPTINDLKLSFHHLKQIYLIAKEAINNSVKYGGRCKIRMLVINENQRLRLILSDNGVGCDLDKIKSGNGLKNIRARSQELQATCEIRSEKSQGMSIDILTDSM